MKLTRDMLAEPATEYACAHCGVLTIEAALEDVDGDMVCTACADREHAAREAEETAYSGPVWLEEGWR